MIEDSLATNSRSPENSLEAIQNFDEETGCEYYFWNTFDNGVFLNMYYTPTFNINPIEEKIKKLHEEKWNFMSAC